MKIKNLRIILVFLVLSLASLSAIAEQGKHQEFPTYFTHANGISIAYQDFGDPLDEVVLLVMGLGGQLINWNDGFVNSIVDKGYRVIRFDNRDIGLSEKFIESPTPGLLTMLRYKLGWDLNAPYLLDDMAADGIAVLDNLGIEKAHVVGVSMGGMIAQIMAGKYPDRILSLTSIMSSSSAAHLPAGDLDVPVGETKGLNRKQTIEATSAFLKAMSADKLAFTDEQLTVYSARNYDRSHYDAGVSRQFWAILGSADRVELLKGIGQPTLVIHGELDPLVPLVHGEHTAALVPESTFVVLDDMGHFITTDHHSRILNALFQNMSKVEK